MQNSPVESKSEFDRVANALIAWAKGKPRDVRWRVWVVCKQLRQGSKSKYMAAAIDCQIKQLRQTAA